MSDPDMKIEAFFDEAGKWRAELAALRAILLEGPLTEDYKWNSPCYTFEGGNVATLWGLKESCALAFFKGALLEDDEGLLTAPGENSRSMRMICFTSTSAIAERKDTLRTYLDRAIEVEKAGLKVEFAKDDLEYPEELADKLDADPEFREAFEDLTPGRRRGYVLHFSQAKQPATRIARIEKAAPRILQGKGMHDR
ncbi:putative protein with duf1801 domain [Nitratireductor indicus C115]|uniref:YdhG-like domain-containing protein n=1 Tax=Nitratireductor indicus C115 TaxID=1231190 RepID=K2PHF3_9HYPH|nr:YdeI/OmpD-associated family protein [Nitratireductor indicus]EKF40552.1 putative protein with duf1801 domain [Nitratireductor indicus C115]SFQ49264.1 Uncharacterized conserved protein YdeI, YjbR/CyaY-like superfamily, DUF1801 family [Nitratireductor indicus]